MLCEGSLPLLLLKLLSSAVAVRVTKVPAGTPDVSALLDRDKFSESGPCGVMYGVRTTFAAYTNAGKLSGLIVFS